MPASPSPLALRHPDDRQHRLRRRPLHDATARRHHGQPRSRIASSGSTGSAPSMSFGSSYAMRIWLDPSALEQYQLTPADVISAVKAQNVQVSVGKIGASPAVKGQQLRATVTAQSLLHDGRRSSRRSSSRSRATDRPCASAMWRGSRLGLESYGSSSTYNGKPVRRLRRAAGEWRQRHHHRQRRPRRTRQPRRARCPRASSSPIPTRRHPSSSSRSRRWSRR